MQLCDLHPIRAQQSADWVPYEPSHPCCDGQVDLSVKLGSGRAREHMATRTEPMDHFLWVKNKINITSKYNVVGVMNSASTTLSSPTTTKCFGRFVRKATNLFILTNLPSLCCWWGINRTPLGLTYSASCDALSECSAAEWTEDSPSSPKSDANSLSLPVFWKYKYYFTECFVFRGWTSPTNETLPQKPNG